MEEQAVGEALSGKEQLRWRVGIAEFCGGTTMDDPAQEGSAVPPSGSVSTH